MTDEKSEAEIECDAKAAKPKQKSKCTKCRAGNAFAHLSIHGHTITLCEKCFTEFKDGK